MRWPVPTDRSLAPVETWERRHGAALAPLAGYRRREPERTLLHGVVRDRLEPFLAAARDRSPSGRGLPAHVERDLRASLDCGLLCRGFARIRCPDCGFERLVAFSCKARSCPSCSARRMEDAADAGAEEDAFAALQPAEVDRRLRFPDPFKHARCAASLDGFSLHAGAFELTPPEPPPGRPAPRYRIPWAELNQWPAVFPYWRSSDPGTRLKVLPAKASTEAALCQGDAGSGQRSLFLDSE